MMLQKHDICAHYALNVHTRIHTLRHVLVNKHLEMDEAARTTAVCSFFFSCVHFSHRRFLHLTLARTRFRLGWESESLISASSNDNLISGCDNLCIFVARQLIDNLWVEALGRRFASARTASAPA